MSTAISNSTNSPIVIPSDGIAISYLGRFWLFLVSNVLSLICCLFVLFHLLHDSTLRRGLHNHVIIVVLVLCIIWELTDVPWTMHVYLFGVVWIQTPTFCVIWKLIDTIIYTTIPKLVAWTSVERHILIFHASWVATNKKRYLVHYMPLVLIVIYGILLYGIVTPINDCDRQFYYNSLFCGYYSCVYNSVGYSLYEFISGGILSSACIAFGSVLLIVRVISQKRRLQRQIEWRKHRKMSIQLLFITSIFFILYLPPVLLGIARRLGVPYSVGADYSRYAFLLSYYIVFLFPFACLGTLPQLRSRIKTTLRYLSCRPARAIAPQQTTARPRVNSQSNKPKSIAT